MSAVLSTLFYEDRAAVVQPIPFWTRVSYIYLPMLHLEVIDAVVAQSSLFSNPFPSKIPNGWFTNTSNYNPLWHPPVEQPKKHKRGRIDRLGTVRRTTNNPAAARAASRDRCCNRPIVTFFSTHFPLKSQAGGTLLLAIITPPLAPTHAKQPKKRQRGRIDRVGRACKTKNNHHAGRACRTCRHFAHRAHLLPRWPGLLRAIDAVIDESYGRRAESPHARGETEEAGLLTRGAQHLTRNLT